MSLFGINRALESHLYIIQNTYTIYVGNTVAAILISIWSVTFKKITNAHSIHYDTTCTFFHISRENCYLSVPLCSLWVELDTKCHNQYMKSYQWRHLAAKICILDVSQFHSCKVFYLHVQEQLSTIIYALKLEHRLFYSFGNWLKSFWTQLMLINGPNSVWVLNLIWIIQGESILNLQISVF